MEGFHDLSLLPKVKLWGDMYLTEINGFWFITTHVPNIIRVVNEFKPLPNDVILASFPKTGSTWLKSLVFSIINRDNPESVSLLMTRSPHDLVPFLDFQSNKLFSQVNDTDNVDVRIFGTHIAYQFPGKVVDSCRVVYIARNPKDTLVAMWHFMNKFKHDDDINNGMPLEVAIEKFCSGTVPYGPYYEHVLGYKMASAEKPDKVFFITYEELIVDTKTHIERLAEFLGCPFNEADKERGTLDEIVKSCSFDTLTSHQVNKSEDVTSWFPTPYSSFFRQGVVGDHRNYLDASTIERIDALTRDKFHAAGFMYGI